MKKIFLLTLSLFLLSAGAAFCQILKPVKWSYAAKKTSKDEAIIYLKATVDNGWHLYSQHMADGGPVKTSFAFAPSKAYTLVGKTIEPKPISKHEEIFGMEVSYFEKEVIFQQKVKLAGAGAAVVKGKLEFMACDDEQCLPPDEVEFSIPIK